MNMPGRKILLWATLAAVAATPVVSQTPAPAPDFSGVWRHPTLPGFEPMASGPTAVTNKTRRPDGASNWNMLVGDYSNPILKPQAAEAVKKQGDLSLAGIMPPTPANQCWPQPVPYIFWTFNMQMMQQKDKITILYSNPDHEFRQVRMNQSHPARMTPSWYGDSVGHYEGDTLVIDTVGIKTGRPYEMVDVYGTPYSEKLHVVERYRLLDYTEAKEGLDRDAKENQRIGQGDIDRSYRGKHLQLQFTVEDEGTFTTPWTATITYGRGSNGWDEQVCAENTREYTGKSADVPTAARADF
ncbi:MAG: hypothetical protein EXR00_01145 [Alphaproteobacteria bacterium]|nr:hypothetical protein [Alphaproteobacteria bacterium]